MARVLDTIAAGNPLSSAFIGSLQHSLPIADVIGAAQLSAGQAINDKGAIVPFVQINTT